MNSDLLKDLNRAYPELRWVLERGTAISTADSIKVGADWSFSVIRFEVEEVAKGFQVSVLLWFFDRWVRSNPHVWKCKRPSTAVKNTYDQEVYRFGYHISNNLKVLDNIRHGRR